MPSTTKRTANADDEIHFMTDLSGRKGLRVALTFGIVAATIEIGVVLWMMYC
ncbi:MAG TPA: hypothetical protein VHV78_13005 [Gemmatimonadaceae bacterium]|nr:hypothetical protein [Gemmatimonadaceae bacterium]